MRILTLIFLSLFCFTNYFSFSNSINLKILFTCDNNGRPLKFRNMEADDQGGIPARATLISKLAGNRKKNNVLILDTGSIFNGRPESNLFNGATDIAGYNSILYDAAAIGITELQRSKSDFEAINNTAEFYYLSANVSTTTLTKREEHLSDSYHIKKFGGYNGIKVGIFSVISEDARNLIPSEYKNDYLISDPIKAAKDAINELKEQKVDIIIALTHLGYYPDDSNIGSRTLANSIKGIDLIIDGRTGLNFSDAEVVNGIPIFQTMKWGLYVGEIDLVITDKKIKSYKYASHPVNYKVNGTLVGEKISEDEKTLINIEKAMKNKDKVLSGKIATITDGSSIDLKTVRTQENEFGNLLCDAILDYTKADIALQNSGGINYKESLDNTINRTSLDKAIPYDNSVVTINLTGEEIIKILEYSISRKGYGSFLQVGGIKFMYNSSGEVYELYLNKTQLNKDKSYKVAINSWLAIGGDGYELFKEKKGFDYYNLTREVLYDYLTAKKTVKPVIDGRMKFTN